MSVRKAGFNPGDVPSKPGVYVFRDQFGQVVYVGKAVNLRRRVSQYFQPSGERRADPKFRSLVNSIGSWETFPVKNEDEALILESRLIKQYAPRYNTLMRDDKRYYLVKINLAEEFPRFSLCRVKKDDGARYFGPFPKGGALAPTIDFLSRHFKVRVCKAAEPGELDRRHCLAGRIRDCSEPCAGKISKDEYGARIRAMIEILDGDIAPLKAELKDRMEKAAADKKFEKAAMWRDTLNNIEDAFGSKARSFERASLPSAPGETAVDDLRLALGLPRQPVVIEGFDISNIGGQLAVGSLVRFENGRPDRDGYRRFKIKTVHQSDDFAMMREVVKRHFSRKIEERKPLPDLVLVDGGRGQLGAALDALVEINCPPLPLLGLAKRNEEVWLPGRDKPVVLDRSRPALKLLQALRDEAHRFAVGFHRELRARRLRESLLDDIPGVGENRKRELLKAFGSVAAIRKASPAEIAEKAPGIGLAFAETIAKFLSQKDSKN